LIVLGLAIVLVSGCAIVLQLFVARRIPDLSDASFQAAQEKWMQKGPENYDMDIKIEGNQPGVVHIEVRGGEVTKMTRDGRSPRQRRTWDVWTVPGQFEMIERELELAADPEGEMQASRGTRLWLRCEFDPELGYPRRFHRAVFGGGAEVYWEVTRFAESEEQQRRKAASREPEATAS
jgi:hypothetical protein